jgi:hypothetical protein
MFSSRTVARIRTVLSALTCAVLLLAGAAQIRADHIDNALRRLCVKIMRDLEEQGYKNVAILKFQVKKGNSAPTLTAGALNNLMATRLENALVMAEKADNPIGLTRGASAVAAAKDKKATYLTLEGRQNLFKNQYPLAWGTQSVEVDAFLTGTVDISPDMKKTKISVKAFDKKSPTLRDVLSFTVDTDLAVLRDTNQNFVVARRSFNTWASAEDPDEELNKIAIKEAAKQSQPGTSRKLTMEEMKEYLHFQILFDGQPVEVSAEGFLVQPTAGQTMLIKIHPKVELGLLLRVNGVNTLHEERDEKADLREYSWWVMAPNTDYTIRGFYNNGQVRSFVAKADADIDTASALGESAQRHGNIEFDVFVDPGSVVKGSTPKTPKANFSFRAVTNRADSLATLKSQIQKKMIPKKQVVATQFSYRGRRNWQSSPRDNAF